MTDEDYQELAKCVIINNKMLQTLLGLQFGYRKLKVYYLDLINETNKEFEELNKKREEKNEDIK